MKRSTMYFRPLTPIVPLPVKLVRPPDDVSVLVIVTVPDADDAFKLPAASEKLPDATVTVPEPADVPYGVNVTEYDVPLPVKLDKAPPVALTSAEVNVVELSLSEIDTDTLEPAATVAEPTDAVGGISSAGLIELLASEVAGEPELNVAVTVKVYEVPLVRPVTVHVRPVVVQVRLPVLEVAVYPVTVPPSGASHDTAISPEAAGLALAAVTLRGALLTSAVTLADAIPVYAPTDPQFCEYSTTYPLTPPELPARRSFQHDPPPQLVTA